MSEDFGTLCISKTTNGKVTQFFSKSALTVSVARLLKKWIGLQNPGQSL